MLLLQTEKEGSQVHTALYNLKMHSAFLTEASIDFIKLQVRIMLASLTAGQALWLQVISLFYSPGLTALEVPQVPAPTGTSSGETEEGKS